jgi:hypothetical protein
MQLMNFLKGLIKTFLKQAKEVGIKVWRLFESKITLVFCLLIFLLDLSYPVTISYDSGHYLWLTSLIRDRQWLLWDPIRNIGFPLIIHLSRVMFGDNANAVHFLLAFLHCVLFIMGINIVNTAVNGNGKIVISKFLISIIVAVVIVLDPTVFGYYNTLLTEFVSATVAVLAIWLCVLVLRENVRLSNSRISLLTSGLVILVVFSWHVKQPYIGAALFPFMLLAFVLFVNKSNRTKSRIVLVGIVASLIAVFFTTQLWNLFLIKQGNPMPEERRLSNFITTTPRNRLSCMGASGSEKENFIDQYLAFSNFYYLDQSHCRIIKKPSLLISSENGAISQRAFNNKKISNIFDVGPYTSYVQTFNQPDNYPPDRINNFLAGRIPISNFLFTSSMLLLPLFFVIALIVYFLKKTELAAILVILLGSSFGNLLGHLVMGILPIDRYLFFSYVLNLLSLVIGVLIFGNWIISLVHRFAKKNDSFQNQSQPPPI